MKNCSNNKEWETEMQGPQVIVEVREAQTELNSNLIINGTSIDGKLLATRKQNVNGFILNLFRFGAHYQF